jgi:HlyD family secretion protein
MKNPTTPEIIAIEKSIEIRSEEVQEIMGMIPSAIIRWGISVLFGIFCLGMLLSWWIRYPDVLMAPVVITSNPPPIRMNAPVTARISHIFAQDGEPVEAGQWLVAFETPAELEDIRSLDTYLLSVKTTGLGQDSPPSGLKLGNLQSVYMNYLNAINELVFFYRSWTYRKESQVHTLAQAKEVQALNKNLHHQLKLKEEELAYAQKAVQINRDLLKTGAISKVEVERSEVELIQKEIAIKQLKGQVHNNQIQATSYQQKKGEMSQQALNEQRVLKMRTEETFWKLKSELERWKQSFLLIAPIAGEVAFFDFWAPNQYIQMGGEVISIIPSADQLIGKATLKIIGTGKLKIGQDVNIKLDNYDYRQYGMLSGKVKQISSLAKDENYLVDIDLIDGLKTTYQTKLKFQAELYGQAEIITDDLRLLERVFYEFKKLVDQ